MEFSIRVPSRHRYGALLYLDPSRLARRRRDPSRPPNAWMTLVMRPATALPYVGETGDPAVHALKKRIMIDNDHGNSFDVNLPVLFDQFNAGWGQVSDGN